MSPLTTKNMTLLRTQMKKYKICKLQDGNGKEWYQIKEYYWIVWFWLRTFQCYYGGCDRQIGQFESEDDARKFLEGLKNFKNAMRIKVVECVEA